MVHRRLPPAYADDAAEFGRRIRARRAELNWSQDKVIAMSGHAINKKTLARIERGSSDDDPESPANPELRVLIELCRVLGGRIVIDVTQPIAYQIEFDPLPKSAPANARRRAT